MSWSSIALVCIPLLPALAGLVPFRRARTASVASVGALALAAAAAAYTFWVAFTSQAPNVARFALSTLPSRPLSIGFMADRPSASLALLITGLGWCVLRFSARYLQGDPRQAQFLRGVALTLAAVTALCLAGDVVVLLVAWVATSVLLHRLLVYYADRPRAVQAAKTKLVFSRLAELCLVAALLLLVERLGTLELPAMFSRAQQASTADLALPALLLVGCALFKSAQFPFHAWLPDTMEAPTPVSALMHAGIINAGGFLVIRFSPVVGQVPAALNMLVVVGTLTAVFGAFVMLTQPAVKRSLAYSTVAQMGFMLLECGLSLFGLALIHIVAHSIYKASAFLRASSALTAPPRTLVPLRTPALIGGVVAGAALVLGAARLLELPANQGSAVMGVVLGSALAYGLARYWSVSRGLAALSGLGVATAFALAAAGLHRLAEGLLPSLHSQPISTATATLASVSFVGLFAVQALLWRSAGSTFARAMYVHALNGFYVGTLTNRLVGRYWPVSFGKRSSVVELTALERG